MKRFVKLTILFSVPLVILLGSLEGVLRSIPNIYSYKNAYMDAKVKNIEVLVLGNSHSYYGINPEWMSLKGFSMAKESQSLNFDLEIIKKYINKMDNIKYFVLTMDCRSLTHALEKTPEEWRVKNYNIYYGISKYSHWYSAFEIFNGRLKNGIQRAIDYYFKKKIPTNCNAFGWEPLLTVQDSASMEESGKTAAERHGFFPDDSTVIMRNIEDVYSIIELAKRKNAKVIFYSSPGYKTYTNNLNPKFMITNIKTILEICIRSDNAFYYNLLQNKSFGMSDFGDADHLNASGAKKLTHIIDSIIQDHQNLNRPSGSSN